MVNFYALLAEVDDEPDADDAGKMTTPANVAQAEPDPIDIDGFGTASKNGGDRGEEFATSVSETPAENPEHAVGPKDQPDDSRNAADNVSENAPIKDTPARAKPLFGSEEEVWEDD